MIAPQLLAQINGRSDGLIIGSGCKIPCLIFVQGSAGCKLLIGADLGSLAAIPRYVSFYSAIFVVQRNFHDWQLLTFRDGAGSREAKHGARCDSPKVD